MLAAWQKIDSAPSETTVIVWGGGAGPMRFARLDPLGQWRGMMGQPLHTKPTYWVKLEPPERARARAP